MHDIHLVTLFHRSVREGVVFFATKFSICISCHRPPHSSFTILSIAVALRWKHSAVGTTTRQRNRGSLEGRPQRRFWKEDWEVLAPRGKVLASQVTGAFSSSCKAIEAHELGLERPKWSIAMGISRVQFWAPVWATLVLLVLSAGTQAQGNSPLDSYIVYMGSHSPGRTSLSHLDRLTALLRSSTLASDSIIYSYQNFDAFSAKLTREHASSLAAQDDVVSVFPNGRNSLQTTHSWSFLGLEDGAGNVGPDSLWTKSSFGKDVILGVIDTGVWPESHSYNDSGYGPIPARWKGECVAGEDFGPSYCNRKLIGGQYFYKGFEAMYGPLNTTATGDYLSPRDSYGHGTHTSSTAGGHYVPSASCLGFAAGTAKGGAPMARLAAYKACWYYNNSMECTDVDILAAFDQGISDGVEVFTVSMERPPEDFFKNSLAVGSFHASQHNISVVLAAGNSGPHAEPVANLAPWMTTVAASSVDRDFPSQAILGSGLVINGDTLSQGALVDQFYPLVSGADVYVNGSDSTSSSLCSEGSLDPTKVAGKIVACNGGAVDDFRIRTGEGLAVKDAGGVGLILINGFLIGDKVRADPHVLPATSIDYEDGLKVSAYINSTKSPVAKISGASTVLGVKPSPMLAGWSSRGPNNLFPLLKPDIMAPGLNILAAWTEARSVSELPSDKRIVQYRIDSGTSMSTPHAAGIVASLNAYHPTWSPAALLSALVTTGSLYDNTGQKILDAFMNVTATPFGIGGGHVNPNSAAEPGLVYDNPPSAYFQFLCSAGFNQTSVKAISGINFSCPAAPASVSNFNYPSLTVSSLDQHTVINRSVTNVGDATSTYNVSVEKPLGIDVVISPSVLEFTAVGQVKAFSVALTELESSGGQYVFGSFTWTDGKHNVRSPLVVRTV